MGLKLFVDNIEDVSESHRSLYEKMDDGKFRLDVDGAVPREKLDEFRQNNIDLLKKLDSFKGVDVQKYNSLLDIEKRIKDKDLVEAGKVDEAVQSRIQSMKTEHDGIVKGLTEKLDASNRQLEGLLIDSAVRVKALELGALPAAMDDILLRAKASIKLVDGAAVPHSDGKPIYGKDGVNPMSVDEWLVGLSKSATHLFGQNSGGGSQGSGSSSSQNNMSKMSAIQKISMGLQ